MNIPSLATQEFLDWCVTLEKAFKEPESYRIKLALFVWDVEEWRITVTRNLLIWVKDKLGETEGFEGLIERVEDLLKWKYKEKTDIPETWRNIVEESAAAILNS